MKEVRVPHITSRWTSAWARRSVLLLTLATFASVTACGSDSPSAPPVPPAPTTPVGDYTIATVNGKPLPVAVLSDTNFLYEVTVGTMSLTVDGKYTSVTSYRQTVPGDVSTYVFPSDGTWVLTGTTVQFTDSGDGSKLSAVWDKGQLTLAEVDGKVTTTVVYGLKK